MKRFLLFWGPVFLFAIFIFIMSSISSHEGNDPFPHFDKFAHFLVYGAFALLIFRGFTRTIGSNNFLLIAILTVVVTVAYGVSDEFHQSFVPARDSDVNDIAADGIGAIAAMSVIYLFRRFSRR
ncbi:MAG TPA: VanZ family protein, partial [Nitrospirota bacterium]|nr:VanZ family protein [Nitrospirota bacterium]